MKSIIAYFIKNSMVGWLIFILISLFGALSLVNMTKEVLPDTDLDIIEVAVFMQGASPLEMEEGVTARIEEAVQSVSGVDQIESWSRENFASIIVYIKKGSDPEIVLRDVKDAVDGLSTLPADIETPKVKRIVARRPLISVTISGESDPYVLRKIAERFREDLLKKPDINYVTIKGIDTREITVEVSEEKLRGLSLRFSDITSAIKNSSLDVSAGKIKTGDEDILIRSVGKKYNVEDIEQIVVRSDLSGRVLKLQDIGEVKEIFNEDTVHYFNGERAVTLFFEKDKGGDAVELVDTVRAYFKDHENDYPVKIYIWKDRSETLRDRIDLLIRNGATGLILVLLSLSIFISLRLSMWVALGIPFSFLGTFIVLESFGLTLNVITAFGFILVIGILVDDAIVVGENIVAHMEMGKNRLQATVDGTMEVLWPVSSAIITTIIAFIPFFYLDGTMGKFVYYIAAVVVPALFFSLLEAFLILPSHLVEIHVVRKGMKSGSLMRDRLNRMVEWVVSVPYSWCLKKSIIHRWPMVTVAIMIFIISIFMITTKRVEFRFFPRIPPDVLSTGFNMVAGTKLDQTVNISNRITKAALQVDNDLKEKYGWTSGIVKNISEELGGANSAENGMVTLELIPAPDRPLVSGTTDGVGAFEFARLWEKKVGPLMGVDKIFYGGGRGGGHGAFGAPVSVGISGPNLDVLKEVSVKVKNALAPFKGIKDIVDDQPEGKMEVVIKPKPLANALGLSLRELARQVRQGFFGEEVLSLMRSQDELKVWVRYPEEDRSSLASLDNMKIKLANGAAVFFKDVAAYEIKPGFTTIHRLDRQKVVTINANVEKALGGRADLINDSLKETILLEILKEYPEVTYNMEGQSREQKKLFKSILTNFSMALIMMFAVITLQFKSFWQSVIVMFMIPFGLTGAVTGHWIMGHPLSMFSFFGIIALAGIIINDAIVFLSCINIQSKIHSSFEEAVFESGKMRFRPIILTTITTVLGLAPIMFEKSMQAQFLIPMAISISFGLLLGTFFNLIIFPNLIVCKNDIGKGVLAVCKKLGFSPSNDDELDEPEY